MASNKRKMPRPSRSLWGSALLAGLTGFCLILYGMWIPIKAQIAQHLLGIAWQESLQSGKATKAWSWADSWPVAKLSLPSIKLEAIILKEAGGEGLAFAPVLLSRSASPGSLGTTVISAHRDTHFKSLDSLQAGDPIILTLMDGTTLTYTMRSSKVAPWDKSGLSAEGMSPTLALTTCWPLGSLEETNQRFIITADQTGIKPAYQAGQQTNHQAMAKSQE